MSNTLQQSSNQNQASEGLQFFVSLAKLQSLIARKFDYMGAMVGMTDFLILYHLHEAEGHKLRRVDLADRIGMTASGITRLLPPIEKIGLVAREANPRDARSSFVALTAAGERVFAESLERAELVASTLIPANKSKDLGRCTALLDDIKRNAA